MKTLPKEGDKIRLTADLPDYGITAGEKGQILVAYDSGDYEVLFPSLGTSAMLTADQFEVE